MPRDSSPKELRGDLHLPSVWDGPLPRIVGGADLQALPAPEPETARDDVDDEIRSVARVPADDDLSFSVPVAPEPPRAAEPAKPAAERVTVAIDADIVAFFRAAGQNPERRINEALRAFVRAMEPDRD
ncbi:BrnA antitoxin family protein [Alsobacter sp. SYSU M60028]|uniref:BrnA antitoxin family protein n=1 Tax=Alsobacter ponti TaxID=2962936 RepID=A0ABT1L870_9HYPH|nr:BrnA antitoxin family protein [Alsobacter ponti]